MPKTLKDGMPQPIFKDIMIVLLLSEAFLYFQLLGRTLANISV